jgi:S1-C subfamily serine protease
METQPMDRLLRTLTAVALLAIVAFLALPYVRHALFDASTPRLVAPRGALSDLERSTIELFQKASPAVVQVVALREGGGGVGQLDGEGSQGVGTGTGFLWDNAGNIVTNAHVVQGARRVAIRTASGQVINGSITGAAPNYDLAVIKLLPLGPLPDPLPVGSSGDLRVGQSAFAIGNPFGLDQSLTTGVISALKRRLPTSAGREIADVIQTDAAINPGNSGGPLLDSAGRLIGVTTAIISPSGTSAGIGFAVPIDTVNRVVPELIRAGRVPTPGIGIVAANEAAAARVGREGVIIIRTVPGSPAERAGLRGVEPASGTIGDVIVAANGRPVRRLADLTDILERIPVPGKVEVTVERLGSRRTIALDVVDVAGG